MRTSPGRRSATLLLAVCGLLAACSSSATTSGADSTISVPTVPAPTTGVAAATTTPAATTSTSRPVPTTVAVGTVAPTTTATTVTATTAATAAPSGPHLDAVGVKLTPVISSLKEPIALAFRPGDADTMYVAERGGRIVAVVNGAVTATVLDMRSLTAPGGERGLLGFAFSPDAARLYTSYTDTDGDSTIDEYQLNGSGVADVASRRQVFFQKQPYANHNGGNVVFGPDGMLYLGLGDGGSGGDPQRHAEDLGSLLGKLLRIDPRAADGAPYAVPADNPFIGRNGARAEIYAYGLRNPWRFSFDAVTGDLWIGDVGQNTIEEVDHVSAADGAGKGRDFGWSAYEGTHRYNDDQSSPNHTPPVHEYEHGALGCSITGGYLYRGAAIPALAGAYLYADYCVPGIHAIDPAAPATAVKILELPVSVVSFGQGPTFELYALSFDNTVYRLDPA